jgi:hypothetical protein
MGRRRERSSNARPLTAFGRRGPASACRRLRWPRRAARQCAAFAKRLPLAPGEPIPVNVKNSLFTRKKLPVNANKYPCSRNQAPCSRLRANPCSDTCSSPAQRRLGVARTPRAHVRRSLAPAACSTSPCALSGSRSIPPRRLFSVWPTPRAPKRPAVRSGRGRPRAQTRERPRGQSRRSC